MCKSNISLQQYLIKSLRLESPDQSQPKTRYVSSTKSSRWAKAEGLVTNRLATHRHLEATEKAERQKYLDPPMEHEEFPAWVSKLTTF